MQETTNQESHCRSSLTVVSSCEKSFWSLCGNVSDSVRDNGTLMLIRVKVFSADGVGDKLLSFQIELEINF